MKSTITIIAAAMLLAITIVGCTKDSVKPSTGTPSHQLDIRPAAGNDSSGNQNPPVPPH